MKNYNSYHHIDLQLIDLNSNPSTSQVDGIASILQTTFQNLLEDYQKKVLSDNQYFNYLIKINYAVIAYGLEENKSINAGEAKKELTKVIDRLQKKVTPR